MADNHVAERVTTPNEGKLFAGWDADAPIEAPLRLHETTVARAWCDYNGHMSARRVASSTPLRLTCITSTSATRATH